ncbi:hypothetical protein KIPB_014478, partial [Kipferlia bialata]
INTMLSAGLPEAAEAGQLEDPYSQCFSVVEKGQLVMVPLLKSLLCNTSVFELYGDTVLRDAVRSLVSATVRISLDNIAAHTSLARNTALFLDTLFRYAAPIVARLGQLAVEVYDVALSLFQHIDAKVRSSAIHAVTFCVQFLAHGKLAMSQTTAIPSTIEPEDA